MNKIDLQSIPASACMMIAGELNVEATSENSKTRKVRLQARSGQPIEHGFWGKVVHDLSGMRMHKNRLPIDYAHNDAEVLGYLNHFETESGDLVVSGALTPFREDDRASEVIFKMDNGVPYEASIFFGGDGIKLQMLEDGEMAEVNGYDFDGPGIIIREWPLRGVAICPYGADANTESSTFSSNKQFRASEWTAPKQEEQPNEEKSMKAEKEGSVESAPVVENEEAKMSVESVEQEVKPEAEAVEGEAVEVPAAEEEIEEKSEQQPEEEDPRAEFKRMVESFGAGIASKVYAEGGTFEDAKDAAFAALKADNESLKAKLAEITPEGGKPSEFAATDEKKSKKLFNTNK